MTWTIPGESFLCLDGSASETRRQSPTTTPTFPTSPGCAHPLPAMDSCPLTADYLAGQDCVLIATDHSSYDYEFIVEHSRLVIDTRNATKSVTTGRQKIVKA